MKKVLIYSEANSMQTFVAASLKRSGFNAVPANDNLIEKTQENDNCIVIITRNKNDISESSALIKSLRDISEKVGIIVLSSVDNEVFKLTSLESGADDFILFPVSFSELSARVNALWRRVQLENELSKSRLTEFFTDKFSLNHQQRELNIRDKAIPLTMIEYRMMQFFLENPGRVISREELYSTIWGSGEDKANKVVDVNIFRLRTKIEEDPSNPVHLVTVWKQGYKWVP